MAPPLSILILCNRPARGADAGAVSDHLDSFRKYSAHRVEYLSFVGDFPGTVELDRFDVVVIHFSVALGFLQGHYLSRTSAQRLRACKSLKVVFLQDEYRALAYVDQLLSLMRVDLVFSILDPRWFPEVYREALRGGCRVIGNLTGYVPEPLLGRSVAPIASRDLHLGYRSRRAPYWLGELAQEKIRIAEGAGRLAPAHALRVDISCDEGDRLYGDAWISFVASCKAVLGTESGSSVMDFAGTIQTDVEEYVSAHPEATFDEVSDRFFRELDGRMPMNQISPRCFEAAALRTGMVLFEGGYSGLLVPWRHFLPLKKDFSNFPEIAAALKDDVRLQQMVDDTYREVACAPANSYREFVARFDREVGEQVLARGKARTQDPYSPEAFASALAGSWSYRIWHGFSQGIQGMILGTFLRRPLYALWSLIPLSIRRFFRPLLRLIGR